MKKTAKSTTQTYFRVGDADHGMWSPETFDTEEAAKAHLDEAYTNRDKKDGHDDYWRNRHTIIEKVTTTVTPIYSNKTGRL